MLGKLKNRRFLLLTIGVVGLVALVFVIGVAAAQETPGFTPTYRNWTRIAVAHISSNAVFEDPELNPAGADLTGFLTIYANDIALETYLNGTGEPFPPGSVIVGESSDMTALGETGVSLEAAPKQSVWMIKDPSAPEETGGWRWELWLVQEGEDVNAGLDVPNQVAACVVCHQKMLDGLATQTDLVFSSFTDVDHIDEYLAELMAAEAQ